MLVEKKMVKLAIPFTTESGFVIAQPQVAYEEYGASTGPVILLCHGGLSSHHAAGKHARSDAQAGWWDAMVGPGKVFDTDRYRILSMNALGSMFGSSGAAEIDPATGRRYGPTFPDITVRDQVHFIKAFLDHMGIARLHLMAGPSMGSLHTLQMAALYPDVVSAAIVVATAGRMTASGMAMHHFMINACKGDPAFADGWYEPGTQLFGVKMIWQVMRIYYTSEKIFRMKCFDPISHKPGAQRMRMDATRRFLMVGMENGIAEYDPNALITLTNSVNTHDLGDRFATYDEGVQRIRCPILLMNIDHDQEFPPECAHELANILNAVRPGQATECMIESAWGHLACVLESEQLSHHIDAWMKAQAL
ncbi:MAG: alpha/beta fold hydrolase [Burkholderiaceae bacterium]